MEKMQTINNIELNRYTIIDTENPNSKCDSICSISLIAVNEGIIELEKEFLVNPEDEFDSINIRIHHITPDMVKDKPTFKELWNEIEKYFTNSVIVAHNAQSADLSKICKSLIKYEIEVPDIYYIDTLKLSKETFPELDRYGLKELSDFFCIDLDNHHNSLCDTKACFEILKEISKRRKITDKDVNKYKYTPSEPRSKKMKQNLILNKLNELAGVINGISVDQIIEEKEIDFLKSWIKENEDYKENEPFNKIIPIIELMIEDNVITDKEKEKLDGLYNIIYNNSQSTTQKLQILNGIVKGITGDNNLRIEEIDGLKKWLNSNEDLKGNYPYDKIYETVEKVLEDNYITEDEKKELIAIFNRFINPTDTEYNDDNVDIKDKKFVLTGEFVHGTREEIIEKITALGGEVLGGVSKKVEYVVVGGCGSKDWSFGNFGSKVKKALELKEKGIEINIVSEEDFYKKFNME